jgi:ubiquitin carboxyl-terminal hydrolase 7
MAALDHDDQDLSGDETDEEDQRSNNNASYQPEGTVYDGSYELVIDRFSEKKGRLVSEEFQISGHKWKLLYFPRGNNVDCLSLYIDAVPPEGTASWHRHTKFRFTLKNVKGKADHSMDATHGFCPREHDWGFTRFIPLNELHPNGNFVKNDAITIVIETKVSQEFSGTGVGGYYMSSYNSRKETGYIGIKNQGATCYMNSLLQSLYHLSYFRRVVYKMPYEAGSTVTIPCALQTLFYRLQTSSDSVSTKELTKSFGWDDFESYHQHDATEFNRVLIDTLETKMKGTAVEGTMEKLFRGEFINYIECVHVKFASNRPEFFYDLQLPVEGCKTVYDSFRSYVMPERMEGQNKYQAEGFGLQEAIKGIRFKTFPDVLELNLNRFKHDFYSDTIRKINDRFEFYPVIDLKEFAGANEEGVSTVYHLHAVLVHSGTMQGGHYYAFIRPTLGPEWYRFDDENVRKATEKDAIDENFGFTEDPRNMRYNNPLMYKKFANAYMLIYVRDSRVKEIFEPIKDEEIPHYLIEKIEGEQIAAKKRQQELAEAHLYMQVSVVTEDLLRAHDQEFYDLIRFPDVPKLKVKKALTLGEFRQEEAAKINVVPEKIRFWNWINRKNKTTRVQKPYPEEDMKKNLDSLTESKADLRLFMEVSKRSEEPYFDPYPKRPDVKSGIMFFKFYDVPTQKLSYVGHALFERSQQVKELMPVARELLNFPPEEDIAFYEEVKPDRIEPLSNVEKTFLDCELMSGDIIVVEKNYSPEEREKFLVKNCCDYYDYLLNRITVNFRSFKDLSKDEFSLELMKSMTFSEVARRVGEKTNWDPDKIRFARDDPSRHDSKISSSIDRTLDKMLYWAQPKNTLYFDLMDVTRAEMEGKKSLKVSFLNYDTTVKEELSLMIDRQATMAQLTALVESKVVLSGSKKVRVFQLNNGYYGDLIKVYKPEQAINTIYELDYRPIYAEEVPEEELNVQAGDKIFAVSHYEIEYMRTNAYGKPFYIVVHAGELISDVKARIQARLKVPESEFNNWKFALVSDDRPKYVPAGTIKKKTFS